MRSFLLALGLLCCTNTAAASEAVAVDISKLKLDLSELRLPEYTECTVEDTRYACYTSAQQVELNKIEVRANGWSQHLIALLVVQEASQQQLVLLDQELELSRENDLRGRTYAAKLNTQLQKEIEQKNDWRAKAETPVVWPYVVGGSMLALGLGLGLGAYLAAGSN